MTSHVKGHSSKVSVLFETAKGGDAFAALYSAYLRLCEITEYGARETYKIATCEQAIFQCRDNTIYRTHETYNLLIHMQRLYEELLCTIPTIRAM